jgi:hypothetical protein
VVMKRYVSWDIKLCSPFTVNRCFGGTYRLHLQDRRIKQVRSQHEAVSKQGSRFGRRTGSWRDYVNLRARRPNKIALK